MSDNDAVFLWYDLPNYMNPGNTKTVTAIVRNQGNAQWTAADGYKLGLLGPMGPIIDEFTFSNDTQNWILIKNAFSTSGNTTYENGEWDASYGHTGGGLRARTGNVDDADYSNGASTAWSKTFYIADTTYFLIKFKWRLLLATAFEDDEYGEARFELNNQTYGLSGQIHLARFTGGKGYDQDTGWQEYNRVFYLTGPANQTIEIGSYNNKKTASDEYVDVYIDDVEIIEVGTASPFGPARYLLDDNQDEIPKYGGIFRGRPKAFDIQLTAPENPGTYDLNFRMLQENVTWFGEMLSWQIEVVPGAYNPSPTNAATGIDPQTILSWTPRQDATGHHIYLGIDESVVVNADTGSPEFLATLPPETTSFDPPGLLSYLSTYYWRID
ncbi:MAG: hypothetical protein ACYTF1_01480 [Planctomycetota bacterium]|jgi:hypothetical protein